MAALLLLSCTDGPTALPGPIDVRAFVVGAAAANLDDNGLFVLPPPVLEPSPVRQLIEAEALSIAVLLPRQFYDGAGGLVERDHGGPIDIGQLARCGRVHYAQTPFAPLPADWDPVERRLFGSWWLFAFCGPRGDVQVSVGVSVFATDLTIIGDAVAFPNNSGEEFRVQGAPSTWQAAVPLSPEGATRLAAICTGRRVSEVPTLLYPSFQPVQISRWRLRLDGPVRLQRQDTDEVVEVDEVFAGIPFYDGHGPFPPPPGIQVALPEQPASLPFRRRLNAPAPDDPPRGPAPGEFEDSEIPRQPDRPIAFAVVRCAR